MNTMEGASESRLPVVLSVRIKGLHQRFELRTAHAAKMRAETEPSELIEPCNAAPKFASTQIAASLPAKLPLNSSRCLYVSRYIA
jgi:hypothetical protein